jgi:hypothetical protein
VLEGRLITWPSRSPDITQFPIWRHMENIVYAEKIYDLQTSTKKNDDSCRDKSHTTCFTVPGPKLNTGWMFVELQMMATSRPDSPHLSQFLFYTSKIIKFQN